MNILTNQCLYSTAGRDHNSPVGAIRGKGPCPGRQSNSTRHRITAKQPRSCRWRTKDCVYVRICKNGNSYFIHGNRFSRNSVFRISGQLLPLPRPPSMPVVHPPPPQHYNLHHSPLVHVGRSRRRRHSHPHHTTRTCITRAMNPYSTQSSNMMKRTRQAAYGRTDGRTGWSRVEPAEFHKGKIELNYSQSNSTPNKLYYYSQIPGNTQQHQPPSQGIVRSSFLLYMWKSNKSL